jgi:hypothetical protein
LAGCAGRGYRPTRDVSAGLVPCVKITMTKLGNTTIATALVIRALDETVLIGMTGILFLQWLIVTFSQVREGR